MIAKLRLPLCLVLISIALFASSSGSAIGIFVNVPSSVSGTLIDNDADGFDTIDPNSVTAGFEDTFHPFRSISRAAFEFDLSLMPAEFSAIRLQILQTGTSLGLVEYEFYGYAGDGMISLADALETATLATPPFHLLVGTIEFDVTSLVEQWILAGETHAGFLIKNSHEEFYFDQGFGVDNHFRTYNAPFLRFDTTPVPEPSTGLMLALGLISLSWRAVGATALSDERRR